MRRYRATDIETGKIVRWLGKVWRVRKNDPVNIEDDTYTFFGLEPKNKDPNIRAVTLLVRPHVKFEVIG